MGLGVLCAGQGTQYRNMFSKLLQYPPLQTSIKMLSDTLNKPIDNELTWTDTELYANETAQPLIAGHTFLCWQALASSLPSPLVFIGYSLGELSAYACAGSFSLETLLFLAQQRAVLMDKACQEAGGIISVRGLKQDIIAALCEQSHCYIAIVNGPTHYLIGGVENCLTQFLTLAKQQPGFDKAVRLHVTVPSHTPLLVTAAEHYNALLAEQILSAPHTPVLAGINANTIFTKANMLNTLSAQIAQTIYFEKVLRTAIELGVTIFLEIGPGHALANIVRALNLPVEIKSIDDFASFAGAAKWVHAKVSEQTT